MALTPHPKWMVEARESRVTSGRMASMNRGERETAEADLSPRQISWGQSEQLWHCHYGPAIVESY